MARLVLHSMATGQCRTTTHQRVRILHFISSIDRRLPTEVPGPNVNDSHDAGRQLERDLPRLYPPCTDVEAAQHALDVAIGAFFMYSDIRTALERPADLHFDRLVCGEHLHICLSVPHRLVWPRTAIISSSISSCFHPVCFSPPELTFSSPSPLPCVPPSVARVGGGAGPGLCISDALLTRPSHPGSHLPRTLPGVYEADAR